MPSVSDARSLAVVPGEPSLRSEFRRGLDGYNLTVGAVAAVALGVFVAGATRWHAVPDVAGGGAVGQGLIAALGLFVAITGVHTAGHAYFGWRLQRGLRAHRVGDHAGALRLLRVVERRGMTHYDVGGHAARALTASRTALAPSRATRATPADRPR